MLDGSLSGKRGKDVGRRLGEAGTRQSSTSFLSEYFHLRSFPFSFLLDVLKSAIFFDLRSFLSLSFGGGAHLKFGNQTTFLNCFFLQHHL